MTQLSREDLKSMATEAIVEAKNNGQFNALLGIPVPAEATTEENNDV